MPNDINIELSVAGTPQVDVAVENLTANPIAVVFDESPDLALDIILSQVGEKGDKGDTGGLVTVTIEALENILAFQPVIATGFVADSNNTAHRGKFIGVAIANINQNFSGELRCQGELTNLAWNWTAGQKIYINQKQLSSVPPTEGDSKWSQRVGTAKNATTILIEIQTSFLL